MFLIFPILGKNGPVNESQTFISLTTSNGLHVCLEIFMQLIAVKQRYYEITKGPVFFLEDGVQIRGPAQRLQNMVIGPPLPAIELHESRSLIEPNVIMGSHVNG